MLRRMDSFMIADSRLGLVVIFLGRWRRGCLPRGVGRNSEDA